MATPPPSHHLASLLQGLSGGTPSPGPPSPAPPAAPRNDVNDLLKMLGGGGGQAPPLRSPPPPQTVASSPPAPSNPGFNLLDLLNQGASGRQSSGALPSPVQSAYSGGRRETAASMRSDVSQAGSPGGSMGGTSLMEMLMGSVPPAGSSPGPSSPFAYPQQTSPPPSASMNPLLAQLMSPGEPRTSEQVNTGFTSPSPPPSESMALRIEPQTQAPPQQGTVEGTPLEQIEQTPEKLKPNPSMFNFVSPFDAFKASGGKRSKSVASPSVSNSAGKHSPVPPLAAPIPRSTSFQVSSSESSLAPASFAQGPTQSSPPTPASGSTVRENAPLPTPSPTKSRVTSKSSLPPNAGSPLGHTRTGSGSLRFKKGDVYPSGKWKALGWLKQAEGGVSSSLLPPRERHALIDVSQPNLATLISSPDAVSKRPISIIRSDLVHLPGRTVDGSTYISYAMNKGRVRLIDESSGARALLKLPTEWYHRDSQVIDLATNAGFVAAITTDGGLVVWRVPTTWTEDDPKYQLVYATSPTDDENQRLSHVRWITSSHLAVSSSAEVCILDVDRLSARWNRSAPEALQDVDSEGGSVSRVRGRNVVDFAFHPTNGGHQLAIISADGSLQLCIVQAGVQVKEFWSGKVANEVPATVILLESDLLLVATEKATVLKLYTLSSDASGELDFFNPLDEVRFISPDSTPMFNKIEYDSRRNLLWISNTARNSLYAFRLERGSNIDSRAFFSKMAEFALDEPVSSFALKSVDFDAFVVSPQGIDMLSFNSEMIEELFATERPASGKAKTIVPVSHTPVKQEVVDVSVPPVELEAVSTRENHVESRSISDNAAPVAAPAPVNGDIHDVLFKEISKAEENIVRRLTSSLQLQSDKLETADIRRQEKVFTLLSQELSSNHSELILDAVKSEVRTSLLPQLSAVVKNEVRSVIQQEISQGIAEAFNSRTVFLSIDKAVKDLVSKTLIPSFNSATADMGAALTREVREDMTNIRKEIVREQSGALVETNDLLSEMSTTIQALGKQVAELQATVVNLQHQVVATPQHPRHSSPASRVNEPLPQPPFHHAQAGHPPPHQLHQHHHSMSSAPFGNPPVRSPMVPSIPVHPATLAYPQPVGPVQPPPLISPQGMQQYPPPPPPAPSTSIGAVTDWGDAFTEAFLSDDPSALSALTRRIGTNLDAVLPEVTVAGHPVGPDGRGPLSQAVLLTTIHKFTEFLPRAFANLADFGSAIVVIDRAARLLDTTDPTIVPYAHRVISQVIPALSRTEELLVQSTGRPTGNTALERGRTFFVDSLRSIKGELAGKAR